jgi:uncharacterized protein (DUF1501 family)
MNTSRRELLKVGLSSAAVISVGGTIPAFLTRFAMADTPATQPMSGDNILVVVQLSGGNDGLNCVVPVGNDEYHKSRPVIGIKDRTLMLNDTLALNPTMTSFKQLFDQGRLAVINGCGYPQPDRSHFRSMEIWQTADPINRVTTGWLGHYIDHALKGTNQSMGAINVGAELPTALVTDAAPVPSIQSIQDYGVRPDQGLTSQDQASEKNIIQSLNAARDASPAYQFLARQATNAILSAAEIRKVTANYKPDAKYPEGGGLSQSLRLIAQLITGQLGTRLFYCEVGGFDTHSNQQPGHSQLLGSVAASIAAFHEDMNVKGFNDKITVMCFSEFGRRVVQNGSNGTDHGTAAPMFVSGGKIRGGLYGGYPSLAPADLDAGDLKYTTDFRRVYATLLERWLNTDSAAVLQNSFELMDFV